MILRVVLCMLALIPITGTVDAGFWDSLRGLIWNANYKAPPMIDVVIINDQPGVMLEVKGKYQIYDPNTKKYISKRLMGKKKYIQAVSSGLKWGELFPGIYQIHIVPDDLSITTVVDGVEYQGSLFIYDIGGTISIVNRVDIEDYLSSSMPQQFHDPFSEETLAAIAIVARTNAFYQSQKLKNKFWAVDATQVGYRGLQSIEPNSEIDHAIKATRYMVLSNTGTYEGVVTPFPAQWGSVTGGQFSKQQGTFPLITLIEAEDMGEHNNHAAQILSKAFPDTHIELIH